MSSQPERQASCLARKPPYEAILDNALSFLTLTLERLAE
jgi:hypothetical protein